MESADKFGEYVEMRTEYIARLEKADLLDDSGLIRREVVSGLGSVGLYGPDSPLAEHCRENPDDPLCWVVDTGSMVDDFLDIREEYAESLANRDLLDVQATFADVVVAGGVAGGGGSVGLVGPDQDPEDFPPGIRPLIRSVDLSFDRLPLQVGALF
jgi:hypothetical protein